MRTLAFTLLCLAPVEPLLLVADDRARRERDEALDAIDAREVA